MDSLLTGTLITLAAVTGCTRYPTATCVGVVASQDIHAGVRGSPVPAMELHLLDRNIATAAAGVLHDHRALRIGLLFQVAVGAQATSVADLGEYLVRLQKEESGRGDQRTTRHRP